ncbi:hypothetical protein HK102_012062, partial [Quaeritorhiza haematococci]
MVLSTWNYVLGYQLTPPPSTPATSGDLHHKDASQSWRARRASAKYAQPSLVHAQAEILSAIDQHITDIKDEMTKREIYENSAGVALALFGLTSNYIFAYPLSLAKKQQRVYGYRFTQGHLQTPSHVTSDLLQMCMLDGFGSPWQGCSANLVCQTSTALIDYTLRLAERRARYLIRSRFRSSSSSSSSPQQQQLPHSQSSLALASTSTTTTEQQPHRHLKRDKRRRWKSAERLHEAILSVISRGLGYVLSFPLYRSYLLLSIQRTTPVTRRLFHNFFSALSDFFRPNPASIPSNRLGWRSTVIPALVFWSLFDTIEH